jgi:prepilin peptidase CpaA
VVLNGLAEILGFVAGGLLVYAAAHDFAVRTVPNWLPLSLFADGVLLRLLDHTLLIGLFVTAITFAFLFAVWLLRGVGGGDVKLWAATVLLIPPSLQPQLSFLAGVLLLGGFLALLYLVLCFVVPRPRASRRGGFLVRILRTEAWRIGRRAPLPYAFAISASALLILLPPSF